MIAKVPLMLAIAATESRHFALSALERLIRAITQGVALGYYISRLGRLKIRVLTQTLHCWDQKPNQIEKQDGRLKRSVTDSAVRYTDCVSDICQAQR